MTSFALRARRPRLRPFDAQGGLGKMHKLFGDEMDTLIEEPNEGLVA